jgi:hypothetical protein
MWRALPLPVGAFATLGPDGSPQITPIGSVYLDPVEPKGYYHPIFTSRLRRNLGENGRFELLYVNLGAWTWLQALTRGRFDQLVAVRLRGSAVGGRRAASNEEVERWQRQVRAVRWTRGYELLWKDVEYTQELSFDGYVPVRFGAMPHGKTAQVAA